MDNIRDFVLNIVLIFLPLVLQPYLYKYKKSMYLYRVLLFLIYSIALVTAMSFPVTLNGIVYDFRSIPLALGILYGGPAVGGGLFLTVITYRYFMEYPNTILYAFSLLPSLGLVALLFFEYRAYSLIKKISLSVIATVAIKLITFFIYLSVVNQLGLLINNPVDTLKTYLLQGMIIAACVYLIEFLDRYYNMQEELIANEKANIVSHMAASVAHEIRNPLTTVKGFIQLFGKGQLDEERRNYYQRMCLEELDRAQQIISDYLALAKPEPETMERLNINEEIRYFSDVLHTYADLNNVQITYFPCDRQPVILGDKNYLRQSNQFHNA